MASDVVLSLETRASSPCLDSIHGGNRVSSFIFTSGEICESKMQCVLTVLVFVATVGILVVTHSSLPKGFMSLLVSSEHSSFMLLFKSSLVSIISIGSVAIFGSAAGMGTEEGTDLVIGTGVNVVVVQAVCVREDMEAVVLTGERSGTDIGNAAEETPDICDALGAAEVMVGTVVEMDGGILPVKAAAVQGVVQGIGVDVRTGAKVVNEMDVSTNVGASMGILV